MKTLSVENIILFHEKIIKETGGSAGVRDRELIESALNRAFMTYDGKDLYPTIIDKIAVITYSLINNHGFVDGNKRIGIAVMIILLKMNNIKVYYTQQELIDLGLKTAEGFLEKYMAIMVHRIMMEIKTSRNMSSLKILKNFSNPCVEKVDDSICLKCFFLDIEDFSLLQ